MKYRYSITMALMLCVASMAAKAQLPKKYRIGTTGCTYYSYCDPGVLEKSYSVDSAMIYTGECTAAGCQWYLVFVQLKEKMSDLEAAEGLLEQYLDFIKQSMGVTKAVGYGKGHRLRGNEQTRGMIDYWGDEAGHKMKVKGWVNGQYIAVLMVAAEGELTESKVNLYLDGVSFDPMPKK